MKLLYLFLLLASLSGCAWLGVETMKAELVEKTAIQPGNVLGNRWGIEYIEIGDDIKKVKKLLGEPISEKNEKELLIFKYPSTSTAKTGKVLCLGWVPIPNRKKEPGYHLIYFESLTVVRLMSFETTGGFKGIYADDSGSGALNGKKSKCRV